MITKPEYGWSRIEINDGTKTWGDCLSYLDDAPFDLLHAMIESCKEHKPVAVRFDAEGHEYIIVFEWLATYIIYQDTRTFRVIDPDMEPTNSFVALNVKRDDLATQLIADVRANVEDWASFYCDVSIDKDEITSEHMALLKERKQELLKLCSELESLIPSDDYRLDSQEEEDTEKTVSASAQEPSPDNCSECEGESSPAFDTDGKS